MSWIPELPLLRRELTELANRRRTYIVRVIAAVVVLFLVFVAYQSAMSSRVFQGTAITSFALTNYMGVGGEIFHRICFQLFFVIQLLMPAFCCACITSEKESNTIGTLLLTRLSPATIIAEKFMSRLVPMLTLLLLTFPVLAHVLTLGGVDTEFMIGSLWLLFCECLLFASVALLCSSWFATTVSAFTVSYCLTGFLLVVSLSLGIDTFVPSAIWRNSYRTGFSPDLSNPLSAFFWAIVAPSGLTGAAQPPLWLVMMVKSIPSLFITLVCLVLARVVLVRRAFPSHSSVLLKTLKVVDTFFKELNDRTTGGIVLIKDGTPLPEDGPIVWRELYKKSLGQARYLFRILLVLEGPTLFICLAAATISANNAFTGLYFLEGFIWILAVLIITVKGATLFSSERAQQTLEPLLATPMTSVDMLNQKVRGMRRLLIVVAIPILTVNFTHMMLTFSGSALLSVRPLVYIALSICGTYGLLNLATWISAGIGLKVHSQTKAVLASFTVIGMLIVLPLAITSAISTSYEVDIRMCSPASAVMFTESYLKEDSQLYYYTYRPNVVTHYLFWAVTAVVGYTLAFLMIRAAVRAASSHLLGRTESRRRDRRGVAAEEHYLLEGMQ